LRPSPRFTAAALVTLAVAAVVVALLHGAAGDAKDQTALARRTFTRYTRALANPGEFTLTSVTYADTTLRACRQRSRWPRPLHALPARRPDTTGAQTRHRRLQDQAGTRPLRLLPGAKARGYCN
jgi:hypothetical protein